MHKHHIVFVSQGGLDFPLNFKFYQGAKEHLGPNGPHQNKLVNLCLKRELQSNLYSLFESKEEFTRKEIANRLESKEEQIEKPFFKVKSYAGIYQKEDIIRRLMGGKLY